MLADIVSTNGNLLLNIPVRGNGTIDEDEQQFLAAMADWMQVNGEAIYSTRPWKVFGEGPATVAAQAKGSHGGLKDVAEKPYTCRRHPLYPFQGRQHALRHLPRRAGETVRIQSLAGMKVSGVKLLGSDAAVEWKQAADALEIQPAAKWPCEHAVAYKISLAN